MDLSRVRTLHEAPVRRGAVLYWMSRDQRVRDNWALLYAQRRALELGVPLAVVFCVSRRFLEATLRMYDFMLRSLEHVQTDLAQKGIGFVLRLGDPGSEIPRAVEELGAGLLVADFSPLRLNRRWKEDIRRRISIPFDEVDAHNVVPCWEASTKLEFGAYTIRPKITRLLDRYLTEIPAVKRHPVPWSTSPKNRTWRGLRGELRVDRSDEAVTSFESGEKAAARMLRRFVDRKLSAYDDSRNDPTLEGQSDLSPYLHFGQISAQRVALEVRSKAGSPSSDAFLEELIIRRELSDNFCWYNSRYDAFEGFPAWAQKTLNEHRRDRRDHLYELEEFEHSGTHDPLWNAAQRQMVRTGKMHGYMRMYWAKKILEWTRSPEEALAVGMTLNDRYSLDGRDPNGYVGVAWSVGGVHDRAWAERPIFGKIRYMNANGCRRKFDVDTYVRTWLPDGTG